MVGAANRHRAGGGDHGAGRFPRGAHLRLQHDHGTADARRNRAGVARADLCETATAEFQLFRCARFQFDFQPRHGRRAKHAAVCGRRFVAGREHDPDAGGLRVFHVADSAGADARVPVGVAAVVVAGAFLFRAAASGLFEKPRIDGQHDFAVQRKRARNANGERFCRGSASGPPVRGGERPGFLAAAENFLGPVHFHAGHADAVAIEPRDFVRLRRLAVCAGKNSAGQRTGGVCRTAPAIHGTGGEHLDHRQFRAAKSGRRAARV